MKLLLYKTEERERSNRSMDGYRKGLTGPVLEYAVKKCKSHRRLSSSLLLENVEKKYLIKQETMMRFKRSK